MFKKIFIIILTLSMLLTGCTKEKTLITDSAYMLGTYLQISIWTEDQQKGKEVIAECFRRIQEIEQNMSVNIEDSEVTKINKNAGIEQVAVSNDTAFVLGKAKEYAALTKGAYDPSIGPLVKLWGIETDHERVPEKNEIDEALKYVNYNAIQIQDENKIKLADRGMFIDLGGIAKGYAADEVANILRKRGIQHAMVNLGGNVYALGNKIDGDDWKVGIQNPYEPTGTHMGIVEINNMTVVSSGNYERYFMKGDIRYHHIIDPKTGYPAENGVISTVIISNSSIDADALSTGIYVLGLEKGMELIENINDVECIIITEDKGVYLSSGMEGKLKISNDTFYLAN
ncbi:FAD:protein FMN transferase [Geosporobacter ferrireducens]|uniref:FAD:protein FMN transferase n=1 Tax=Geosporobacter ferrireducens TaxID=1424294 RepID=A0A1D8GP84_9FIRM|nr:FAD:protein FMN transferase [Geosporobacter ferrireducens]AOT72760.1 hypothetical protein Gferi_26310 [Geosporobacter ferrireducens]MTI55175.1 FAD:protein FMN transferase [Geosporobacter ferrireducens]